MKRHSEETQTLRAGSRGSSQKFTPAADRVPGARDGQNLIIAGNGHNLYLQTQDQCTQFRVIVVTPPPPHTHT